MKGWQPEIAKLKNENNFKLLVQDDKSPFKKKMIPEETLRTKINKYRVLLGETLQDKTNNNTPVSTGIKGMQ